MYSLSSQTVSILSQAGWDPSRKVDASAAQAAIAGAGRVCSERALRFLREFGGLDFSYPHFYEPHEYRKCHLDPIRAVQRWDQDWLEAYDSFLNSHLTVVGECEDGEMQLFIDDDGGMYAAIDTCLLFVGESEYDALNTLCEGRPFTDIDFKLPSHFGAFADAPDALDEVSMAGLATAGWYSGRRSATDEALHDLRQLGYSPSQTVIDFVSEFNGLMLAVTDQSAPEAKREYAFDIIKVAHAIPRDHLVSCLS